ncbi:MAG: hypothetical protein P4L81_02725, partial [Candidatus Pacebacteria bacterium]|nr:hypothetical protein [Candidatus Paceibacterota bacterium]
RYQTRVAGEVALGHSTDNQEELLDTAPCVAGNLPRCVAGVATRISRRRGSRSTRIVVQCNALFLHWWMEESASTFHMRPPTSGNWGMCKMMMTKPLQLGLVMRCEMKVSA